MARVNFQNLPNTTTPLNATNLNSIQDSVYSTSEIKIGNWIDGKPVYRKVYSSTNPSNEGYQFLQSGVAVLINSYGFIKYDGTNMRPINMTGIVSSTSFYRIDYSAGNNSVYSNYSDDLRSREYRIILEYTKTTD